MIGLWNNSAAGTTSPLDLLPDTNTLFEHEVILTMIFNFLFYLWHRALNTEYFKYHKKHHEIKVNFRYANDHESVLVLAGNILWKMIPPVLIGCHLYTVCVFCAAVNFFTLLHPSGFGFQQIFSHCNLFQGLLAQVITTFITHGGVLTIWDQICGSHKERTIKKTI